MVFFFLCLSLKAENTLISNQRKFDEKSFGKSSASFFPLFTAAVVVVVLAVAVLANVVLAVVVLVVVVAVVVVAVVVVAVVVLATLLLFLLMARYIFSFFVVY